MDTKKLINSVLSPNKTQEEIIKRWEDMGLLKGYEGNKTILANAFESVSYFLIICDGYYMNRINIDVYPIIRRILSADEKIIIDNRELCDMLQNALLDCSKNSVFPFSNIDLEAETCALVGEKYVNLKHSVE